MKRIEDLTPHLDPDLVPMFSATPRPTGPLDVDAKRTQMRQIMKMIGGDIESSPDIVISDLEVPAVHPSRKVLVRVFAPKDRKSSVVLAWIHGGGFFSGHHEDEGLIVIPWIREIGCTVVSIGYRQPPEAPFPAAPDDCFAALDWMASDAAPLGFKPSKLAIGGISAGGCLAAATALRWRDEGRPALCFQLLLIPAFDNKQESASMQQLVDPRIWNRQSGLAAWEMYIGPDFEGDISPYAAPARAKDLSGLPPTFMEVAGMDTLRDEAIAYAQRLMIAGVSTELRVYPGAYHASTFFQPKAGVSQRAQRDILEALKRALA